jgi:hypothetical protein
MDVSQLVHTVAIYAIPVLFAITLHEAAHGYVARHFGDMTAYAQGASVSIRSPHRSDRHDRVPIVILVATKLAPEGLSVRLGEAGAGQLLGTEEPEAEHDVGRRGRTRLELAMAVGWAILTKAADLLPAAISAIR